jgi:hypothetical protein
MSSFVSLTNTLLKLLHVLLEGKYIYLSKSSMQKENVEKKESFFVSLMWDEKLNAKMKKIPELSKTMKFIDWFFQVKQKICVWTVLHEAC